MREWLLCKPTMNGKACDFFKFKRLVFELCKKQLGKNELNVYNVRYKLYVNYALNFTLLHQRDKVW